MSVEQRSGDPRARESTRTSTDPVATAAVTPSIDVPAVEPPSPMASRIERVRLRAQVAALERELAASECRRQAIVGQYELQLEERRESSESGDGVLDVVRRLVPERR
ncbi:hypothetical protein ACFO5R_03830 [Halosolutus amylolyticus]|uniref:Uncharacterized protein n=1 Tax=Halosolutus amylolyticus TaxID=2932267 RepID=A0ABD5PL05_9EURY|nr:hypothetical protein [Halosolutus amylolyticus]